MEDIYEHQHAKGEPNWFTHGVVIGTDAHTHSPPTQTLLSLIFTCIFICLFIPTPIYVSQAWNSGYRNDNMVCA